jgi:hypothetical protein
MRAFARRSVVVVAMSIAVGAGIAVVAPALGHAASAVGVPQGCSTAVAKGGPGSCSGDGVAELSEFEKDCLQGAVTGAIPGGVLRNPKEAAAGAVGGCISAATAS